MKRTSLNPLVYMVLEPALEWLAGDFFRMTVIIAVAVGMLKMLQIV